MTRRQVMLGAGALVGAGCFARGAYRGTVATGAIAVPAEALAPLDQGGVVLVRADGAPGPIGLRRRGGELVAVVSLCTHRGCELDPSPGGWDCPCHGSAFDESGVPLSGPADRPLARLPVRAEGAGARIEVVR